MLQTQQPNIFTNQILNHCCTNMRIRANTPKWANYSFGSIRSNICLALFSIHFNRTVFCFLTAESMWHPLQTANQKSCSHFNNHWFLAAFNSIKKKMAFILCDAATRAERIHQTSMHIYIYKKENIKIKMATGPYNNTFYNDLTYVTSSFCLIIFRIDKTNNSNKCDSDKSHRLVINAKHMRERER